MKGAERKKGRIKAYSKDVNAGVIQCEDGSHYGFRREELVHGKEPHDHEKVEFDDRHDKQARKVDMEEKGR